MIEGRTLDWIGGSEVPKAALDNETSGIISTVLGTGVRGDGPEHDPLNCKLNRPHDVSVDPNGRLLVDDSEAHRIRRLE